MLEAYTFSQEVAVQLLETIRAQGQAFCPGCGSSVPLKVVRGGDESNTTETVSCPNFRCQKKATVWTPRKA